MKLSTTLAAALCGGALLLGAPAQAQSVKIGLLANLTGSYASEGQDAQKILQLMAEDFNAKGGIGGNPIELVVGDAGSTPRAAATAATRLVDAGVQAVVGTYGSAITEATQDIFDEANIVQVADGSTAIRLTEKGLGKFFRTAPRDDEQGRVATASLQKLDFKQVAILHDNTSYAKGLADEVQKLIEDGKALKIVFFDALVPGESDYSVVLAKIRATNPDVIFFTGYYPEVGRLLRQKQEMGWNVPILGGDATNHADLITIAGTQAAAGYRFVSPPLPSDLDTPATRAFLAAYRAKYNGEPGSIWSVNAGDAFGVIVTAIRAKGNNGAAIADYLHKDLKDYEGLSGKIAFDAKGDRVGDFYRLYEVAADGKFVLQP